VLKGELLDLPFLFSNTLNHANVADMLLGFGADDQSGYSLISAGFVRFTDGKVVAHGESVSLRLKSRPEEDSKLISINLKVNGIGIYD